MVDVWTRGGASSRGWMLGMVMAAAACSDDGVGQGDETSGAATSRGETTSDPSDPSTAGSQGEPTTSEGADSTGSSDTEDPPPPPPPAAGCEPLPPPEGDVLEIGPEGDLPGAIASAPTGRTIVLRDGTYDVSGASYIVFSTPGVTLRSQSGDPSAVVIDGGYSIGEVLSIAASNITIAELTVQRPLYHPIHVTGAAAADTTGTLIYRVRAIDPGQQAIKINASTEGFYADDGTVACSYLELTDAGRPMVTDCYTGGIDAHHAWGWEIRDNHIEGFWCEAGLSEHAVHFWNGARDTVVERNTIVDCVRGVGLGLGDMGNGTGREYDDDPCPGVGGYVGHYGGIIRNNTIWAARPELFGSQFGFDSGVALEQACGTSVVHNSIVALEQPFTTIEYRWPNTSAEIANNLTTHGIVARDGGQATLAGNLSDQGIEHFVDPASGDLHLAAGSSAIDAGVVLPAGVADEDIDGDARDGSPDVGADER